MRQMRLPIGPKRTQETEAYAQRHYGHATHRIRRPRVIVEHLTVNGSVAATYNTFAPDLPDPELHELPGLCSQFAIARNGVIVQLAPMRFLCRHTVGLNWAAIGIEHVGYGEQDVLGNPAQLHASLRLTRWLRCRFEIKIADVIGHAESLSSPYHRERVAALRTQTHGDWQPWAMRRYRALLRNPARRCPRPAIVRAAQTAPALRTRVEIGRSVRDRAIVARVIGDDEQARHRVLVVGCIHGTERAGEAVTRHLRDARPPSGVSLWLVDRVNPDGCRAGTRQNANGVDLNRNAPWQWRSLDVPWGTYYSGPRAASEPESRAIMRLVRRIHPAVTVWYHQHAAVVDKGGGDERVEKRYARRAGLPWRDAFVGLPGIWTGWQNATRPRATAFVVELPAGALDAAAIRRHAGAVLDAAERIDALARSAR
jgi:beta-N-acetylhexosaminidase